MLNWRLREPNTISACSAMMGRRKRAGRQVPTARSQLCVPSRVPKCPDPRKHQILWKDVELFDCPIEQIKLLTQGGLTALRQDPSGD